MTKFTINPRVVYSGDTCYVTIAAFIVISQSIYLLTHLGARTSTMSCLITKWARLIDSNNIWSTGIIITPYNDVSGAIVSVHIGYHIFLFKE